MSTIKTIIYLFCANSRAFWEDILTNDRLAWRAAPEFNHERHDEHERVAGAAFPFPLFVYLVPFVVMISSRQMPPRASVEGQLCNAVASSNPPAWQPWLVR